MLRTKSLFVVTLAVGVMLALCVPLQAGSLTPPGAPASTMKTLDEVEPRTAILQSDLPLTISDPGSYYFAENLTFATLNASAITFATDGVTIDLNGFALTGPGKTAGTSGAGIDANSFDRGTVKNETVTGFRIYGVVVGDDSTVTGVRSQDNGAVGIRAFNSCTITNNTCLSNGAGSAGDAGQGIYATFSCLIQDNLCKNNIGGANAAGYGIRVNDNCQIINNVCENNDAGASAGDSYGISAGQRNFVTGNTCTAQNAPNGLAYGIHATDQNIISDNLCASNDTDAITFAFGIECNDRNTVSGNTCDSNGTGGGGAILESGFRSVQIAGWIAIKQLPTLSSGSVLLVARPSLFRIPPPITR